MNITKPQYEELMEKLTDKTLNFGCRVKDNMSKKTFLFKDGGYSKYLCDKFTLDIPNNDEDLEIIGHPLLIGDVLEKMYDSNLLLGDNAKEILGDVLAFWTIAGGASKSIQTIVEDCGWEKVNCHCGYENIPQTGKCETCLPIDVLKNGEANELLSFLYNLFIK